MDLKSAQGCCVALMACRPCRPLSTPGHQVTCNPMETGVWAVAEGYRVVLGVK